MGMSLGSLGIFSASTGFFVLLAISRNGSVIPLIIWLVVSTTSYVASLYLHPRLACWHCEGSGKHKGTIFSYSHRACTSCAGSGHKLRWGARALNID